MTPNAASDADHCDLPFTQAFYAEDVAVYLHRPLAQERGCRTTLGTCLFCSPLASLARLAGIRYTG